MAWKLQSWNVVLQQNHNSCNKLGELLVKTAGPPKFLQDLPVDLVSSRPYEKIASPNGRT